MAARQEILPAPTLYFVRREGQSIVINYGSDEARTLTSVSILDVNELSAAELPCCGNEVIIDTTEIIVTDPTDKKVIYHLHAARGNKVLREEIIDRADTG